MFLDDPLMSPLVDQYTSQHPIGGEIRRLIGLSLFVRCALLLAARRILNFARLTNHCCISSLLSFIDHLGVGLHLINLPIPTCSFMLGVWNDFAVF